MGRISGQQRYAKDVQYKINDMKQITISIILLLLIGGTAYKKNILPFLTEEIARLSPPITIFPMRFPKNLIIIKWEKAKQGNTLWY